VPARLRILLKAEVYSARSNSPSHCITIPPHLITAQPTCGQNMIAGKLAGSDRSTRRHLTGDSRQAWYTIELYVPLRRRKQVRFDDIRPAQPLSTSHSHRPRPRSIGTSGVPLTLRRIKTFLCHSLRPRKRPFKNECWTRVHRQIETKRNGEESPRILSSGETALRRLPSLPGCLWSDGAGRLGSWIGMDIAHHPEDRKGRGNLVECRKWCILVHGHMGSCSRCALQISLQDGCALLGGNLF
jgi:hypothetical protein